VHTAAVLDAHGKLSDEDLVKVKALLPHDHCLSVGGLMNSLFLNKYEHEHEFSNAIYNVRVSIIRYLRQKKENEITRHFKPRTPESIFYLDKILYELNDALVIQADEKMKNEMLYAATYLMKGYDPYPDV